MRWGLLQHSLPLGTAQISTVSRLPYAGSPQETEFKVRNRSLANTQGHSVQPFYMDHVSNCASNVQGFCHTGDVSGVLPGTAIFDTRTISALTSDAFEGIRCNRECEPGRNHCPYPAH
jgi:hypothetical protein